MLFYSFLFPVMAIIAIVWFIGRYLNGKNSLGTTLLWSLFWIIVSIFAIFPDVSTNFAALFGITRGLDFVILMVFVILFYTILKMYFIVDKMQNDLNKIVKEVALNNEITLDDEDE